MLKSDLLNSNPKDSFSFSENEKILPSAAL